MQVFLHYVDQNGPFTRHQNDQWMKDGGNQFHPEDEIAILELKKIKNLS